MPGYLRYPSASRTSITFVAEDDVWCASIDGGTARRLTTGLGPASRPCYSPDGQWIAFTGREEGQDEVYLMPAEGGEPRRLTFLGSTSWVAGWTPDGRVVFSSHYGQPMVRLRALHAISPDGGHPERLPFGPARTIAYAPGGAVVIGRHHEDVSYWKRYRGGRAGVLWIDPAGEGDWRPLIELEGNVVNPFWVGRRIHFVSDHEGVGNIYSCSPTGKNLRRHTDHATFCVRSASAAGSRIVYAAGADLWRIDKGKRPRKLDVSLRSARTQRQRKFVDAGRHLEDYALHPRGTHSLIVARGKVFAFGQWAGAVQQVGERHGVRYRLARYLHDGERVALVSDASGEERIEVHALEGAPPKVTALSRLDVGRALTLETSPTADRLALTNHRQELVVVELASKRGTVVYRTPHGRLGRPAWSPCGGWLAFSAPTTAQTRSIMLVRVAGETCGEPVRVTPARLRDSTPAWDPEGNYLYFLGQRIFDPVYDGHFFELSFPRGGKPYAIALRPDVPSPFVAEPAAPGDRRRPYRTPDEEPAAEEKPKKKQKSKKGKKSTKSADEQGDKKDTPPPPIEIALDGIERRIVAFPLPEGRYTDIAGLPGKVLLSTEPVSGSLGRNWRDKDQPARGTLAVYDLHARERTVLIGNGINEFAVSADRRTLVYRERRRLRVLEAGKKPEKSDNGATRKSGWLRLARVRLCVDPSAEWRQMLREAWRLMRDHFWTADMSGVDWEAVYRSYEPLLERVTTRAEFGDLVWEMQGELGTSHAYEMGGDYRSSPPIRQGFLGVDLSMDGRGRYRIDHVLDGDPWIARATSPFNRPGVDVRPGATLLAIDGVPVGRGKASPQELLVHRAGTEVAVTVGDARGSNRRTVTVRAIGSETAARYREWVEGNRQRVIDATDGRAGYLHIPNMGPDGFAEFHRMLLAELDRPSLVVDVRGNGGGHVSQLLLEKLRRERVGYNVSRWGTPTPYPRDSFPGPLVALIDENAGSDGDIFGHCFKLFGLGPLIGTRSWGGVIGIWPRHQLADGGITTQPEFSFWFQDVGWGVENRGTEPDIEVPFPPQAHAAAEDPQLDRAIAEILRLLEEAPPAEPDFGSRPRLARPELPPR